jgi:hypothetical protein
MTATIACVVGTSVSHVGQGFSPANSVMWGRASALQTREQA